MSPISKGQPDLTLPSLLSFLPYCNSFTLPSQPHSRPQAEVYRGLIHSTSLVVGLVHGSSSRWLCRPCMTRPFRWRFKANLAASLYDDACRLTSNASERCFQEAMLALASPNNPHQTRAARIFKSPTLLLLFASLGWRDPFSVAIIIYWIYDPGDEGRLSNHSLLRMPPFIFFIIFFFSLKHLSRYP